MSALTDERQDRHCSIDETPSGDSSQMLTGPGAATNGLDCEFDSPVPAPIANAAVDSPHRLVSNIDITHAKDSEVSASPEALPKNPTHSDFHSPDRLALSVAGTHDEGSEATIQSSPAPLGHAAPISRLPIEILSDIFLRFRDALLDASGFSYSTYLVELVQITYICRAWRETTLHSGSLWTHISSEFGLTWIQAFLVRSQGARLSVHLGFNRTRAGRDRHAILACLAPCYGRIRSLYLKDRTPRNIVEALNEADARFPLMRYLEVEARGAHDGQTAISEFPCHTRFPRLEAASFMVSGSWRFMPCLTLPTLTELKIHDICGKETLSVALEALGSMEQLTALSITGEIPRQRSSEKVVTVTLPNLVLLEITHATGQGAVLLQSIAAPNLATAHLREPLLLSPFKPQRLLAYIKDFCSDLVSRAPRAVVCSVERMDDGSVTWYLGTPLVSDANTYPMLRLSGMHFTDDGVRTLVLPTLRAAMPLDQVTALHTNVLRWTDVAASFIAVRNLWMYEGVGQSGVADLALLQKKDDGDTGEVPALLLLPRLKYVELRNVDCEVLRNSGLCEWLQDRQQRGHMLEEMRIDAENPSKDWMDAVSKSVGVLGYNHRAE